MRLFTSSSHLLFGFLLMLGLVVHSGCAQMGKKDSSEELAEGAGIVSERESQALDGATVPEDDALPLVIPPNPYLANPPKVPAQAKLVFKQGLEAMRNNKLAEAKAKFNQLVGSFPELSGPYVNLGIIAARQKQNKEAENYLLQAIAVNELNLLAYNHLGVVYREQGDFFKAEQAYKDAIKTWPGYAEAHLNLAILYDIYMGRLEEALRMYKRYTRLTDSPDKRSRGWIADIERRIADRQAAQAAESPVAGSGAETGSAADNSAAPQSPPNQSDVNKAVDDNGAADTGVEGNVVEDDGAENNKGAAQ